MFTPVIRRSWPVVALLTVGLIIAYLFLAFVIASVVSSLLPGPARHHRSIVTAGTGDVLIHHNKQTNAVYEQYYTDLDGNRAELNAIDSPQSLESLRFSYEDYGSSDYIRGRLIYPFLDREQKPRKWYFIVEHGEQRTGYFEVYDSLTFQRLFFVGQQGRMEQRPTEQESFSLPEFRGNSLDPVLQINEAPYYVSSVHGGIPTGWGSVSRTGSLFDTHGLLRSSENRLWTVNFTNGEIEPFLPELTVLDMKSVSLKPYQVPDEWVSSDSQTKPGILFRTPESLVWYGLHSGKLLQAEIPTSLQEINFAARFLGEDRVVYQHSIDSDDQSLQQIDLLWANRDGEVVETRERVITQPSYGQHFRESRWGAAAIVPGFLPFASLLAIMPVDDLAHREEITQAEARWTIVRQSIDVLLTLFVIGGLLAAWFYRACKARSVTFSWAGLAWIVLMGPFGYITLRYVTWYRRPALQPIESRPGIDIICLPQAG
ncbi:hypothetical protein [Rubinisphaera margarita]|uniref:hypothetical protein n=1 Tax=Rubinisphaera margarita TaxID=2909586 RepID=UPI001EE80516|nr:hypothetical protein [Rubinisphaera margarita]MCG6154475.1 hypothetical protein [Rubinisphaera margarita]